MTKTIARPRLFLRHRYLLSLLQALGGIVPKTDFQKLLFLLCRETSDPVPYDFVPYKYGAFSFTSYADRRKLIEKELLQDSEDCWALTHSGREAAEASPQLRLKTDEFAERHEGLRGQCLIAFTYREHPYYATRSEIAHDLLARETCTLQRIDSLRPAPGEPGLATIGYEGRSLEAFLNALLMDGVTVLCDVRRNPLSRKYGFSKWALSSGCEGLGIKYRHLPELGIESSKRRSLVTQDDYESLFEEYRSELLPRQGEALGRISSWIRAGERVALTCYEASPEQCHRGCVAQALETEAGVGLTTRHL